LLRKSRLTKYIFSNMSSPNTPVHNSWTIDELDYEHPAEHLNMDVMPLLGQDAQNPFEDEHETAENALEHLMDFPPTPGRVPDPTVPAEKLQRWTNSLATSLLSLTAIANQVSWDNTMDWDPETRLAFHKVLEDAKRPLYEIREEISGIQISHALSLTPDQDQNAEMGTSGAEMGMGNGDAEYQMYYSDPDTPTDAIELVGPSVGTPGHM
ncbi:hypothetical protein F5Y04DRAFT_256725, partial [Hypomontagnella monticulosa]